MAQEKTIEMWFEFGSTYSYLSVMRIERLVAEKSLKLVWRPFMLGPIFKELGWQGSPFLEQKEKLAYMWVDMARQCAKYGIRWKQPSAFPRVATLPLRVALLGAREPWIAQFCKLMMEMNFVVDCDINAEPVVIEVLSRIGLDAQSVLAAALADDNKNALRVQTQRARELGIFGGPTFMVGEEMFWGNDRLEDAIAFAAQIR